MTAVHARQQLVVIALVSALELASIVLGQLQMIVPMLACILGFGLLVSFGIEKVLRGVERHPTRRPVSSPLDLGCASWVRLRTAPSSSQSGSAAYSLC